MSTVYNIYPTSKSAHGSVSICDITLHVQNEIIHSNTNFNTVLHIIFVPLWSLSVESESMSLQLECHPDQYYGEIFIIQEEAMSDSKSCHSLYSWNISRNETILLCQSSVRSGSQFQRGGLPLNFLVSNTALIFIFSWKAFAFNHAK